MERFQVEEISPWQDGKETWRVLRVYFPGSIETHCQVPGFAATTTVSASLVDSLLHS
jgi:hypothetical protein